jgi:uncharacterized protein (TIGR02145 family)
MNYKKIFNVVGVVAVSTVLFVGCAVDNNPEKGEEGSGGGSYVEKGNDIINYRTIKIGTQTWMAENLDYAIAGSVCYDGSSLNCAKYGRLYTWNAAMHACPANWHLPSNDEWTTLTDYVGVTSTAGTKLKSTSGWNDYNERSGNGTDEFGFSALPGGSGFRYLSDSFYSFYNAGSNGCWWSATEDGVDRAMYRLMDYSYELVGWSNYGNKAYDFRSIRCVQD